MSRAVRFATAYARMRALKSGLWSSADRALLLQAGTAPDGTPLSSSLADVFPGLARWYATLTAFGPPTSTVLLPLLRLHEIENVKLLWRAAMRSAPLETTAWRPLHPLDAIAASSPTDSLTALVERLARTPYGAIARAIQRSHAEDLAAAELGFDRWAVGEVHASALALRDDDRGARDLLLSVCRERDVDLLRRGVPTFALQADLVAKSTVVLSREHPIGALVAMATWTPAAGPLWTVLPRGLRRIAGDVTDWGGLTIGLRQARRAACRRAFVAWPFQLAPIVAATLLRDEQARSTLSLAAARGAQPAASTALPLVLAAGPLEA